jgi:hypothetical protein
MRPISSFKILALHSLWVSSQLLAGCQSTVQLRTLGAGVNTGSGGSSQATQLVWVTQPALTATPGTALTAQPVVQIENIQGNVVTSAVNLITISLFTDPGCSIPASTSSTSPMVAAASGIATLSGYEIDTDGSYYYEATASGLTSTSCSSSPVVVSGSTGTATQLAWVTNPLLIASSGTALATQPVVQIEDQYGNLISSATNAITISLFTGAGCVIPVSPSVSGASQSAANGIGIFTGYTIDTNGSYYYEASAGSLSATSCSLSPIVVSGSTGTATKLAWGTNPSLAGTPGTALTAQPIVQVTDAYGNVVSGATNTITMSLFTAAGCGTPVGPSVASSTKAAVSGTATFSGYAIDATGTYYYEATSGLLAATSCSASGIVIGANYYVNSATGSDSNNGTALATPFATLQKAANTATAGQTVCIEAGNGYGGGTSGTSPMVLTTSGTLNAPITFTGCNGEAPITSAGQSGTPVISGTQSSGVIYGTYPLSYINLNGLQLAGWNSSITWAEASQNTVAGTALTNPVYNADGVFFGGGTGGDTLHHITITNMVVHDFPLGGIDCNYCDYTTVTGNIVYNNGLYSPYEGSGISLYEMHNIDSGTGTKNYVENNFTYGNVNYIPAHSSNVAQTTSVYTSAGATYLPVASSSGANYTQTVIDATSGCIPPGTQVAYFGSGYIGLTQATTCTMNTGNIVSLSYVTDGEGIIIDDNLNDQSDSIPYVGRVLVQNNISFNNGGPGVQCSDSQGCDFAFNTAYSNQNSFQNDSASAGEISDYGSKNSNFYNNIAYANAGAPSGWDQSTSGTTWSTNLFYGGNAAHTLPGSNNVTSNPLFVSPGLTSSANFQLQSGSPAIDVSNVTFVRTSNFAGSAVGTPSNLGAY